MRLLWFIQIIHLTFHTQSHTSNADLTEGVHVAVIIDGKAAAEKLREELRSRTEALKKRGTTPGLAVVLVGQNPASQVYVRMKRKACESTGIRSFDYDLDENTPEEKLLALIEGLNKNREVHGILVQLPLPKQISSQKVLESIAIEKDVDCFHPCNVGRLATGEACLKPCTPAGIMELIASTGIDLAGKNAVVLGRSNIVGKPTALLLLEQNATVTICHSKTENLRGEVSRADVVVAAVGRAKFVKGPWIKRGAVVIDVGINRTADGKLVGDVDFDEASRRASYITPVPGGVGPMTIAMLLKNTVEAAKGK